MGIGEALVSAEPYSSPIDLLTEDVNPALRLGLRLKGVLASSFINKPEQFELHCIQVDVANSGSEM